MADYAARRTTMVDTQVRPSDVTKFPIIDALLKVERQDFVPSGLREAAYAGDNLDLGNGRVLLEARTFGKMLDALDVQPGDMVLDIGCGLGYSSAVVAQLCEAVVAVEDSPERAAEAQQLLGEHGVDNVAVVEGPLPRGAAKHGPYDVILIQGAIGQVSQDLQDQLKDGGRIAAIFMEDALGICRIGLKFAGHVSWRYSFNASAPVLPGFEAQKDFAL